MYKLFVLADLFRYGATAGELVKHLCKYPEFRFVFVMRTVNFLKGKPHLLLLYYLVRLLYARMKVKYGINIPYNTPIGPGLFIGHYGGIVVHSEVKIGRNCNLNHGVTIGIAYGGNNPGVPIIGNNVYLGPGSKIFGGVTIGNNVAVGANCVVTKSVPENAVIVGIPGKVISYKGSGAYVVNQWSES